MGVPGNRHSCRDLDHENSGEVFELREPGVYYSGIFQEDSIMILTDRIELNPRICNGRPVIKGTRIPVSLFLCVERHSCFIRLCPKITKGSYST